MKNFINLFYKYIEDVFFLKTVTDPTDSSYPIFPKDFKSPMDKGGPGKGAPIGGFGGNSDFNRLENRKDLKKTPVLLVHGNAGSAHDVTWGMLPIRNFLKKSGYKDSEIWALSYLGEGGLDITYAHQDNIEDIRGFIKRMMDYLAVEKIDIIAHSVGVTLTRAWMKGLKKEKDGFSWNASQHYGKVGTLITLAAANKGITSFMPEWDPNGEFIKALNKNDETPFGKGDQKKLPDGNRITYVALWSKGDVIEMQNPQTGKLIGADLNKGYALGGWLTGHEQILKSEEVFEDFLPYLNRVSLKQKKGWDTVKIKT